MLILVVVKRIVHQHVACHCVITQTREENIPFAFCESALYLSCQTSSRTWLANTTGIISLRQMAVISVISPDNNVICCN